MAIHKLESADMRPPLRWYQFSLSGLLHLTLFVAILLSVLGVGSSVVRYDATIMVERRPLTPILLPSPGDNFFGDAVWDSVLQQAMSDSMMESIAQLLRQRGVETIDGQMVLGSTVKRHVSLERNSESFLVWITASTCDPKVSRTIACAFFDTFTVMTPELLPAVKQRYLDQARSELWGQELRYFESQWREREDWLASRRVSLGKPGLHGSISLWGNRRDPAYVRETHPYWNVCVVAGSVLSGIGVIAFGINRWRRYRVYKAWLWRRSNDVSDIKRRPDRATLVAG